MRWKSIIFIIVFICCMLDLYSQRRSSYRDKYKLGMKASYSVFGGLFTDNLNNFNVDENISFVNGFSVGLYQQFEIKRKWSVRSEALFSMFQRDLTFKTEGLYVFNVKNKNKSYFVELPIGLYYKLVRKRKKGYRVGVSLINTFAFKETNSLNSLNGGYNGKMKINSDTYEKHSFYNLKFKVSGMARFSKIIVELGIIQNFIGFDKTADYEIGAELSFLYRLPKINFKKKRRRKRR